MPVSLDRADTIGNLLKFLLLKTGPFTSNIAEAGAFVRTALDRAAPDLQFHFGPVYYLDHGFRRPDGCGFSIGPTMIRPQSRGCIALRSANPLAPPLIQPNYLSSAADLLVLVEGIKLARRLAQSKAFKAFRGAEVCPGEDVQSDDAIAEYVRNAAETVYHPVDTCKMGSDPLAVVDDRLRVRGVEGLRVVDAAIMPTVTGGNTNAPTIMIAEKAADLIKESV